MPSSQLLSVYKKKEVQSSNFFKTGKSIRLCADALEEIKGFQNNPVNILLPKIRKTCELSKNKFLLDLPILEKVSFYFIKDVNSTIILEDKTKRGLEIKDTSTYENLKVKADKGMIHDMDGIGHWVPIRWYFSKDSYELSDVQLHANAMDKKYTELRELTCPQDDD